MQDAQTHQRLLDIAAHADVNDGVRQGLDDAKEGKTRPAREFFAEFEVLHIRHGARRKLKPGDLA